jgi:prephenate dehydratase
MAEAKYNISHLASRPTREPWRYQFFLEFEHVAGDPHVSEALAAIRRATDEFRLLGTYPRWMESPPQDSARW